jgi:hypothetical protein
MPTKQCLSFTGHIKPETLLQLKHITVRHNKAEYKKHEKTVEFDIKANTAIKSTGEHSSQTVNNTLSN